jgi:hypothetical protein
MSRTLKDSKPTKENKMKKQNDLISQKYLTHKQNGFCANSDEEVCPECGGLINFTNGFLLCTDCEWSTFETEELNFQDFRIHEAI